MGTMHCGQDLVDTRGWANKFDLPFRYTLSLSLLANGGIAAFQSQKCSGSFGQERAFHVVTNSACAGFKCRFQHSIAVGIRDKNDELELLRQRNWSQRLYVSEAQLPCQ